MHVEVLNGAVQAGDPVVVEEYGGLVSGVVKKISKRSVIIDVKHPYNGSRMVRIDLAHKKIYLL